MKRQYIFDIRLFIIVILFMVSYIPTYAQLGSGWVSYSPTKRIHLDDENGLQTFTWTASKSVCSPPCADYNYNSSNDTETFRLFDNRTNRSEIRLQNEYSTGSRQFEGYVTIYAPLDDESLMQIFGSTSGATQMMIRGYAADGGSLRGAGQTLATNIYGVELRVNVIHMQEDVGNKIIIYINGVKKAEIADNEAVTNYHKYGNYGTLRTDEAVVKWRRARFYRDGTPPSGSGTQPNLALNKTVTASGSDANVPANMVDGDAVSRWSAQPMPQWIEVDLGATYDINKTEIVCYQDRAYQYTIEAKSTATGSYTQIVNRSTNTTPGSATSPITDNFNPVTARYVRVHVTGASNYTGAWASLTELRVFGSSTAVADASKQMIGSYKQPGLQVTPNPTAQQALIRYSLPDAGKVKISVYNMNGQEEVITNAFQQAGNYQLPWSSAGKPAGVYMVCVTVGNRVTSSKIVVQ